MAIEKGKFVGKRLYELRVREGWTYIEVEKRTGIHRSWVSVLEKQTAQPGVKTIAQFCKAFKVKPEFFFEDR